MNVKTNSCNIYTEDEANPNRISCPYLGGVCFLQTSRGADRDL
jgi:hypothetical protein